MIQKLWVASENEVTIISLKVALSMRKSPETQVKQHEIVKLGKVSAVLPV